ENGDYVMYKRLDFEDGAKSFTARLSGNTAGIELYLDSLNTPVASMSYAGTGSFSKWETVTFNIPAITGKHNLYIKFTGGEGYLVNLNWFKFNKDAVPVNGILAENLLVNNSENASDWKFAENAGVGSLLFGDRDFTWTALPEYLNGAEQILTACDSKNFTGDVAGTAVAVKDITVSVAVDSRVENTPAFLTDWVKTDFTATSSNDVTFVIYHKDFSAGDVIAFGSNGQSTYCVNYTIFLQEFAPEIVTDPVTETAPVLLGDADESGSVNILDVIVLNKAILGKEQLSEQGMKCADADGDGVPSSADALLIMKHIVGLIHLNA
ncbi:MAG: carbohydrate-binding protein, partial [Oscillospiraceae bacterium]|nr:carbohydrate-binding protein [Oscillospiraceae bacterium]